MVKKFKMKNLISYLVDQQRLWLTLAYQDIKVQ